MGLDIAAERAAIAEKKRKEEFIESERKRKEAAALQKLVEQQEEQKTEEPVTRKLFGNPVLDCRACKNEKTMIATSIDRFGGFIRLIGYLIATPSILGFLFSVLMFWSTLNGSPIGSTAGMVTALVFAGISLIGGLVGYLLLTKKKVFRCKICGCILDRA